MRIGIDFHVLQAEWQGSGIRRYIEGLYGAATKLPSDHEFVFLVDDASKAPANWPDNTGWQGFGTTSRLARLGWKTSQVLKQAKVDCYHVQFVAPWFKACKEVVTVHDILFHTHPQFFSRTSKYTLAPLIKRSVQRASLVLTISEYSKAQIMERYGVDEDRILITSNGIDKHKFSPGDPAESARLVREAFGLDDYVLSVGRIEPRKNHKALVRAYAHMKGLGKTLPRLVLVGGKDFGYQALASLIQELGVTKDVLFLHGVSDQMLPHLYRAALVMAYPSFAEGFGIPPLEAMACGCPVITSGTTALPEVVGNTGWLVEPDSWESVEAALIQAISSPSLRSEKSKLGLERAATFSWEESAKTLLSAYDRL